MDLRFEALLLLRICDCTQVLSSLSSGICREADSKTCCAIFRRFLFCFQGCQSQILVISLSAGKYGRHQFHSGCQNQALPLHCGRKQDTCGGIFRIKPAQTFFFGCGFIVSSRAGASYVTSSFSVPSSFASLNAKTCKKYGN